MVEGKLDLGWREWVALPELGLPRLKAKLDTGARTSALHAFDLGLFLRDGQSWVRFSIHPLQRREHHAVVCEARVMDERVVMDSGGHAESRLVIVTPLRLGAATFDIEVTLTPRDPMRFRLLLGRTALEGRCTVDPARSFVLGRPSRVRRPAVTRRATSERRPGPRKDA